MSSALKKDFLRIATVNVNGIRAAYKKGMAEWLEPRDVDILCLQEVRAPDEVVNQLIGEGWYILHAEAEAKGRAGVAIASRQEPVATRVGIGDDYFATTGRWVEADYVVRDRGGKDTTLTVVSAYVHSGEADTPKQVDKYRFLDVMTTRLPELAKHSEHALVVGDLNVGHTELDIKNWKGNTKRAGFLPEERAYFDRFFGDEIGWRDVHRGLAGNVEGPYTWWSQRGKAFDTDTGWRIDYHMATPGLAAAALSAVVDRAPSWDTRFSDHAPLVVDYQL
ncbi:exodeoxyribonuclease III [Arthrobacter bambusae]|uniref:exodeoxyribonuclease III n=1 Tax=Arthrobacter TaxID=1663 RepID=UPI0009913ED0|nr:MULTISPECIES: exodeoxyribonuclease III [Arthrobacter]MCI0142482.1 exodeoxyribonuclease III [Arthrobacter bambusae]MDQ0209946.1 exodeoxyribonuclease-3 [Arthrobacter bambusae]MDQ0235114.1 exodeoxyribonuclease-3 [Arthrobacter bambusae]OOP63906.1 exodeoxyribonuclease III [Arthrobacter sp. SRS-W-1-2016]UYY82527.1 exodeoxyribonuclease III [Arthrobacter sp. YA7-1]